MDHRYCLFFPVGLMVTASYIAFLSIFWVPSPRIKIWVPFSPLSNCLAVLLLLLTSGMLSKKMEGASSMSPRNSFQCLNKNCYRTYKTERGLRQHFWRSESCKNVILRRYHTLASCQQIADEGSRRHQAPLYAKKNGVPWQQNVLHSSMLVIMIWSRASGSSQQQRNSSIHQKLNLKPLWCTAAAGLLALSSSSYPLVPSAQSRRSTLLSNKARRMVDDNPWFFILCIVHGRLIPMTVLLTRYLNCSRGI